MKILIGTNNQNKLAQYRRSLAKMMPELEILSLSDLGIDLDVEEDGDTLLHNAKKKAKEYAEMSGLLTMADDTGLFVDALGGEPGIHAKRWAEGSGRDRCMKILERLKDVPKEKRTARYEAIVACYDPKSEKFLTSKTIVKGLIVDDLKGENGFGYDPIFLVDRFGKRFAELTVDEIDSISHRTVGAKEIIEKISRIALEERR
jgi:XTP/dITP diphosphohydrolase